MNQKTEIHLQLGGSTNKEFELFWNEEVSKGRIPEGLEAKFQTGKRPPGGLGLAAPPEVIIAFVIGFAGAIGAGVGSLLWRKLKEFFESRSSPSVPKNAVIIIGEASIKFHPRKIDSEIPSILKQLEE
jgi:hypothetical protein